MKRVLCLIMSAVVMFMVVGGMVVTAAEKNANEVRIYKNLTYGDGKYQNYDLYTPIKKRDNNYGLILYIHGGSFTGGDKIEGAAWGDYFAKKGYVFATINYTVNTKETPSDLLDMYADTEKAVEAIYKKSKQLGYNLTKMATTGLSAGGTLALMYAYNQPEDAPVKVKFTFQQVGPVSFEPSFWGNNDSRAAANFVSYMSGERVTADMVESGEYQSIVDKISPVAFVNKNTVPTIMAYGKYDSMVPVELKYILIEALKENKVHHTYIEYPNSGHLLLGDPDKAKLYKDTIDRYINMYFN